MSDFDHGKYSGSLDLLVEYAYKEYQQFAVDLPRHQAVYIRTYLWLSSLLAAFEMTAFLGLYKDGYGIAILNNQPTFWFYLFSALALATSLTAFVLGMDTLRGRGTYTLPLGDFTGLAQMAHNEASDGSQSMRSSMIQQLAAETLSRIEEIYGKARRLRKMCWLLLGSVAFAILTVMAMAVGPPQ